MSARLANDIRSALGPARDQGARPTCLAFAASDAHGGLRSPWAALSAEAAFFHAQRRAGRPPSSGAALPFMIEALSEDGQHLETDCPYPSASPDPAIWSLPSWSGPTFQCLGAPVAASWDDLIAALDDNRLVLMLMMLSPGFFAPDADGVIWSVAGGPDPAITSTQANQTLLPLCAPNANAKGPPEGGPLKPKLNQRFRWSERQDSNLRHPAPKAGALPG